MDPIVVPGSGLDEDSGEQTTPCRLWDTVILN